jgi:cation diffusion facilitator CzcD-associated flavoprotein CzcO
MIHAMESLKTKAHKDVSVTCFERSSQPGGVWLCANENNPTGMHANLWTNGASHSLEYFDDTLDEHFERPRQDLVEYIIGRVTKKCPDFLGKYVR